SDEDLRARIDTFLGSIDTPISAAQWRALGPKAVPMLEEIATDAKKLPTRRARALDGLSLVAHPGDESASSTAARLARSDAEPPIVRMAAVRAAGRLIASARLMAALQPVLEGSDARLRAVAAETLARRAPDEACDAILAQAEKERGANTRWKRAIALCED